MEKRRLILRNFTYSALSNILSFLVSTVVVLIVPKLMGVEQYGYWQLYLLYTSFSGFLLFGWNDGIYLRYGGLEYTSLDKKTFFSQFAMNVALQLLIGLMMMMYAEIALRDSKKEFVFRMTAFSTILTNCKGMLLFILLATNRISKYAISTTVDRLLYLILIVTFLFTGYRHYELMIAADLIAKAASLGLTMYICHDIVFRRICSLSLDMQEAFSNIRVGIKLMLSNIASQLIVGLTKLGIENKWDIATFSKISLTLSISNLLLLLINAMSLVIFPVLRRVQENRLPQIYIAIRDIMMPVLMALLVFYYPLSSIASVWLPQYAESLRYMAILYPICVYEGKMSLLVNTYLKTMRKEKALLRINLLTLLLSLLFTLLSTQVLESLDMAVLSIIVLLALRSIVGELYISHILFIDMRVDIGIESGLVFVFVIASWFLQSWYSTLIYGIFFLIYVAIKREDLLSAVNIIMGMKGSLSSSMKDMGH